MPGNRASKKTPKTPSGQGRFIGPRFKSAESGHTVRGKPVTVRGGAGGTGSDRAPGQAGDLIADLRDQVIGQTAAATLEERTADELEALAIQLREAAALRGAGAAFADEIAALVGDALLDEETVRRAARIAVAGQAWQQRTGKLFETRDVAEVLGVTRQRVNTLAGQVRIIAVQTQSGQWRYPAWQFDLGPEQRQQAASAHRTLVEDGRLSPWTALSWLTSRHPDLAADDPVSAIRDGQADQVLVAARRDAHRAAQ